MIKEGAQEGGADALYTLEDNTSGFYTTVYVVNGI
jgi:hypothetical protein